MKGISIDKIFPEIMKYQDGVEILFDSKYKELFESLTSLEQLYLLLKIRQFTSPTLTDEKIAQIMEMEEQDLASYQVMSPFDQVNEMVKQIKKSS